MINYFLPAFRRVSAKENTFYNKQCTTVAYGFVRWGENVTTLSQNVLLRSRKQTT